MRGDLQHRRVHPLPQFTAIFKGQNVVWESSAKWCSLTRYREAARSQATTIVSFREQPDTPDLTMVSGTRHPAYMAPEASGWVAGPGIKHTVPTVPVSARCSTREIFNGRPTSAPTRGKCSAWCERPSLSRPGTARCHCWSQPVCEPCRKDPARRFGTPTELAEEHRQWSAAVVPLKVAHRPAQTGPPTERPNHRARSTGSLRAPNRRVCPRASRLRLMAALRPAGLRRRLTSCNLGPSAEHASPAGGAWSRESRATRRAPWAYHAPSCIGPAVPETSRIGLLISLGIFWFQAEPLASRNHVFVGRPLETWHVHTSLPRVHRRPGAGERR